jgi:hypothetical protein
MQARQAMKLLDLLIDTRRDLLTVLFYGVEGVDESRPGWAPPTANATTRLQLRTLLRRRLRQAEEFGIFLVTRYGSCNRPSHTDELLTHPKDKVIGCSDDVSQWTGTRFCQGVRTLVCPCAPDASASRHHVVDELVVRKIGATKRHRSLIAALSDVQKAINHAGDDEPRSSIQEYLLRAALNLNEGILPQQGVDDDIAARNAERAIAARPVIRSPRKSEAYEHLASIKSHQVDDLE